MRIHFVRTTFSIFPRRISTTIIKAAVPIYVPTVHILVATFCILSELIGSSCFLLACRSIRRRFFLVAGLHGHALISSSIPSGYPGKLFPSRLFMPMGVLGLSLIKSCTRCVDSTNNTKGIQECTHTKQFCSQSTIICLSGFVLLSVGQPHRHLPAQFH